MPISEIISLVAALLLLGFTAIIIYTKREKANSQRLHKIANYKFRAEEAQDLHDGLAKLGLDKAIYKVLLQRVEANYNKAYQIDVNNHTVNQRLAEVKEALVNFDETQYFMELPDTPTELQGLSNKMLRLVKYFDILHQKKLLIDNQYQELTPSLQQYQMRLNTQGHLKIAQQAQHDGHLGTARQSYEHVRATLLESDPNDAYVQENLITTEQALSEIKLLEVKQLHQTEIDSEQSQGTDQEIVEQKETVSISEEQKMRDAALDQAEINRRNEAIGGHEVKKKW